MCVCARNRKTATDSSSDLLSGVAWACRLSVAGTHHGTQRVGLLTLACPLHPTAAHDSSFLSLSLLHSSSLYPPFSFSPPPHLSLSLSLRLTLILFVLVSHPASNPSLTLFLSSLFRSLWLSFSPCRSRSSARSLTVSSSFSENVFWGLCLH